MKLAIILAWVSSLGFVDLTKQDFNVSFIFSLAIQSDVVIPDGKTTAWLINMTIIVGAFSDLSLLQLCWWQEMIWIFSVKLVTRRYIDDWVDMSSHCDGKRCSVEFQHAIFFSLTCKNNDLNNTLWILQTHNATWDPLCSVDPQGETSAVALVGGDLSWQIPLIRPRSGFKGKFSE